MQKILIVGVCAFALGIAGQILYGISLEEAIFVLCLGLSLTLLWRRKSKTPSAPFILISSICLVLFSLGVVRTEVFSQQFGVSDLESEVGKQVELEGIVVSDPEYKEKTVQLYLNTSEDKILVSSDRHSDVNYGDKIIVRGKLERPTSFETELGRTFNYPGYLLAREIEYRVSFAEIENKEENLGNPIISSLLFAKHKFVESVQAVIPEPEVALGNGLLLGVKSSLGDDIEKDFRETGIIHVVVLSGYNVMLVVTFISYFLSFFLSIRPRLIFSLVSIIAFALVVGLSATVVRASIMATLVLFAQCFGRQYDVLRALFLAGLVMLVINPYLLLYDVGFQLSFMATLGLVLIVPYFETNLLTGKAREKGRDFLLATVSTQIAVLPLLLYHIGQVSLVAVLVNLLVLPVVPIAMLLTFFTGLVGFTSIPFASSFGFLASVILGYVLFIARIFSDLSFATISVNEFSLINVFLAYVFIGVVMYVVNQKYFKVRDNLHDWKIEEETEKAGSQSEPAETKDLPIFFR